jgi:type I restriction enzyme S subunit
VNQTKFKQTEIGLIPENWGAVRLSAVVDIIGGGTPKTTNPEYWGGDIPWLSVVDFNNDYRNVYSTEKTITQSGLDNSSTKILDKGDIIISARGTVGALSQLGRKMAFNQSCYGLETKDGVANDFLYYMLKYKINSIKSSTHGSVFDTITRKTFDILEIPFPPLPEQHAIAEILSSLDDKIELNRRMNATLEQIAQAIFKQWFIDFEFPDGNGQPYKSSGGEMVESELGEIPRGWEVKDIGDICKTFGGGTPKTKEPSYWEDGDIFWATPTDMTSLKSPIIFDTSRKITEEGLNKSSAKLLPIGSVLMTSRATLGYFAITKVPICTNQGFISMVCDGEVSNYYLLHTLKNKVELIENLASGSTYLEINKSSFRSISVIIPPSSLIEKFDNFVKLIYDKIYLYESESQNLSLIRDELLPKLMSGKIRLL